MTVISSKPSIVIEFGDYEAISKFGKDMQNFAIEEGTVIKITGISSVSPFKKLSVMESCSDGKSKIGVSVFGLDPSEFPKEGKKFEVTGKAVKGAWFMEFHTDAENVKILE